MSHDIYWYESSQPNLQACYSFGNNTIYERVLQLENYLSISMCKQFHTDNLICPSSEMESSRLAH